MGCCMSLTPAKYIRVSLDLEKSEYQELRQFVDHRGWTIAYFLRNAIETEKDRVRHLEMHDKPWSPAQAGS